MRSNGSREKGVMTVDSVYILNNSGFINYGYKRKKS